MIPGLYGAGGGGLEESALLLIISDSENNVDVFARMGSPTLVVEGEVRLLTNVIIGSDDPGNPAMSFIGFATGSKMTIVANDINQIGGAGGAGGDGNGTAVVTDNGGGGGGGAGTIVGPGGLAGVDVLNPPTGAENGTDGTDELGGLGGRTNTGESTAGQTLTFGGDGGDAIEHGDIELTIDNLGSRIWGGGGGGAGGKSDNLVFPAVGIQDGFDGGGAGLAPPAGYALVPITDPGNALRGTGAIIWTNMGDVRGPIGP